MSEPITIRSASRYLLAFLIALTILAGRVLIDSYRAISAARQAEQLAHPGEAIRWYGHAVAAYLPANPFGSQALDRLEGLAAEASARGDQMAARQALESARAAILEARSLYLPYADRLSRIDAQLASLYAGMEDRRVAPGASLETRRDWHAERLARRPGPRPVFALAALLGLAVWLGAVIGFIRKGLDPTLRLRRGPVWVTGTLFILGFALFVAGLRLA